MDCIVIDKETIEKARKNAQKRERKAKIQRKAKAAKEWVVANREVVVGAIGFMSAAGAKGVSAVRKAHKHREERTKERRIYDHSAGHRWNLRRKLSNEEWAEVDRRKKNGEKLGDILEEMKVLE